MFFYRPDITFLIILPGIILAMWAQSRVSGAYAKWSRYRGSAGITGGDLARDLLRRNGIYDVTVTMGQGELTDHYDPRKKEIQLSRNVYGSSSVAALAIAAHETGHVVQHARGYAPLEIRNNLVPVANIGSTAAWPLFIIGLLIGSYSLAWIGVLVFSAALLFHLITLPVEYNASSRAMAMLADGGYVSDAREVSAVKDVLGAAALTYVAATAVAALQLLRMVALLGGFGERRR